MGQNYIKNIYYNKHEEDKTLNKLLKQGNNSSKNKDNEKNINTFFNNNKRKHLLRSNFIEKFNENESGVKNICNLLNLIYDNNVNKEQMTTANRTIYEVLFDNRDSLELIEDNINKNEFKSQISFDKNKNKINNTNKTLLNPNNNMNNNFNYNFHENINDINNNIENDLYINKTQFPKVTKIYSSVHYNNYEINQKENIYINNQNKSELILPNNYGQFNETKQIKKTYFKEYNIFESPIRTEISNIKAFNNNNINYDFIKENLYNNINYSQVNNIENINYNNYNNINENLILNNNEDNNNFYVIENDLPKKINNKNLINIKSDRNTETNFKTLNEENNAIIYNKKNIMKNKIPSNDLKKNNQLNSESNSPIHKSNYDYNILKKENEITINYSEKKKSRKSIFLEKEEICKNQEIFIEKSPNKNKKDINENLNKHKNNLFSEQITRKYFTIINNADNNLSKESEEENSINENNNDTNQNDDLLNFELNKKKMNLQKKELKIKQKDKSKNKNKNIKHSKKPKKQPVVNIQIDLKDLMKLEKMEKKNTINKKEERKPKKVKEYYDYPEDLKYNVFGKQYKFSYKNK